MSLCMYCTVGGIHVSHYVCMYCTVGGIHVIMYVLYCTVGGIHVKQNSIRKDNEEKKEKAKSKRQHRMTDKEKKFVLSKDTGTYSQLMPVAAPATNAAEVKQISPPPSSASDIGGGRDYMGNYYLLEVGSMETTPPTSPETDSSIPLPLCTLPLNSEMTSLHPPLELRPNLLSLPDPLMH